jgi:hypothetical protein
MAIPAPASTRRSTRQRCGNVQQPPTSASGARLRDGISARIFNTIVAAGAMLHAIEHFHFALGATRES